MCVQSKLLMEYAFTCPNLKMGDGTHKLPQYNVIWSTIKCLGHTHIIEATADFSKHLESTIDLKRLSCFFVRKIKPVVLKTTRCVNYPFIFAFSTIP